MNFKNINLSKEKIAITIITSLVGCTVANALVHGCASHDGADAAKVDKELVAAKSSLDSITTLSDAAVAKRDMYRHKYDSLYSAAVVGGDAPSVRRQKIIEWCGYRDSLEKYNDLATVQSLARFRAQRQVDWLMIARNKMK